MKAYKLQAAITLGVTAASALAALPAVLPLPIWEFPVALADYPARRMPIPSLFGWAFLVGIVVGAPLGLLVWKLPFPARWHPVRNVAALLLATGMATIPVVFVLIPNALGGVPMAIPGLATAVVVLYRVQRFRRIPLRYCLVAVAWGGTFAITAGHQLLSVLHVYLAYWLRRPDVSLAPDVVISAPLWEEAVKGLGVLAIFAHLRQRYDDPVHGFVLGAMVGAGFNFMETSRYAMYNFNAAMLQVWVRQWVSGITFGHVLFTGLTGAAIALAYRQRRAIARIAVAAGGFGLAVVAHFVWNWMSLNNRLPAAFEDAVSATLLGFPLNFLILSGPFLLLLTVTLVVAGRRERAELYAGLAAEVRAGQTAVTVGEATVLARPRLRLAHRLLCARALGWWAYRAVGNLHQLQLDLAHERFRLAREVDRVPPTSPSALRRDIRALRVWINTPMEAAP
ncbi:PrsW family intramembrane metalloprotease [Actinopolymorpha sp. B11F2]|uniref:PrsW family intramembrane metalloprotease n=1 Tax=Actinopolymorpha sp. B11F2 TaxID=3160862 RepID=UPI0032E3C5D4